MRKKSKNSNEHLEASLQGQSSILFNSEMRKTFVEGVLQDVKGYFESKTDGAVSVTYEDYCLKNHEFGFKLVLSKTGKCSKQMFNEVVGAAVNVLNYMFGEDSESYDLSFFTTAAVLEAELVSNW